MPHPNPDVETKTAAGFLRKRVCGYISRDWCEFHMYGQCFTTLLAADHQ